jgi:hypothetical protein
MKRINASVALCKTALRIVRDMPTEMATANRAPGVVLFGKGFVRN